MATKQDYYDLLGVDRSSDQEQIKQAYRRLARKYHPDVNSSDEDAESRFKDINEAYEVLKDPQKREIYDRYGHQGFEQYAQGGGTYDGGFGNFGFAGDIFDLFMGGSWRSYGESARPGPEQGDSLGYNLELTLEEAARGVKQKIQLSKLELCDACDGTGAVPGSEPVTCQSCHGTGQVRQQQNTILGTQIRITTCPSCHGEGEIITNPCVKCHGQMRVRNTIEKEIEIPAGVDTGMNVRFAGDGDAGLRGGPPGDLIVGIRVKPHATFKRKGNDLWCEIHTDISSAALGSEIDVPGIDENHTLEISAGTQSGEIYKLRGKGMPDPRNGHRGNLNAVIKVDIPTKLSAEEKELLQEFARLRGNEIREPRGKSFFERIKDAFNG